MSETYCTFEDCKTPAKYGFVYNQAERCKEHKEDRKLPTRVCSGGCRKRPSFKDENGVTKFCSKCKPGSTWKECEVEDCKAPAKYGFVYNQAKRCKEHKEDRKPSTRVCAGSCRKRPSFKDENGVTKFCAKCKPGSTWKECEFENCHKKAKYASVYNKPERCEDHKENRRRPTHVCAGGCVVEPTFKGSDGKRMYCQNCLPGNEKKIVKRTMTVKRTDKICNHFECTGKASYAFYFGQGETCGKHKKDPCEEHKDSIGVGCKKCKTGRKKQYKFCEGFQCRIEARYNFVEDFLDKSTRQYKFCKKHSLPNMQSESKLQKITTQECLSPQITETDVEANAEEKNQA